MRLALRTTSVRSVPAPTPKRPPPLRRPTEGRHSAARDPVEVRRLPAEAGGIVGAEREVLQASANGRSRSRPIAARCLSSWQADASTLKSSTR